jgi:polar amino acid transport system permease protein
MKVGRISAIAALVAFLAGTVFATFSELRVFLPALLKGAAVTLQVFALSVLLFFFAAFVSGVGRGSPFAPVRWISAVYIEVFRGTSLLVQLFWFFFVLPEFGITLSPLAAGVVSLGLNFGAYGAEVVRGAIVAVPRGHWEACTALNISPWKRMTRVVLPQALVVMIPGMGNLTIELIKATSVVSAVTLVDITYASVQQNQIYYRTLEIFAVTLILYYCFSQLIRFSAGLLEDRCKRHLPREARA